MTARVKTVASHVDFLMVSPSFFQKVNHTESIFQDHYLLFLLLLVIFLRVVRLRVGGLTGAPPALAPKNRFCFAVSGLPPISPCRRISLAFFLVIVLCFPFGILALLSFRQNALSCISLTFPRGAIYGMKDHKLRDLNFYYLNYHH